MGDIGPFRVLTFDTLGSTNDEAMDRLRRGEPGGFFVTAERQTSGRGRRGRSWVSSSGNLHASIGLVDPSALPVAPQLGLVAAVALADALRRLTRDDPRLTLKWPNDVLIGGAKLAGILLESAALADGRLACVIGFGVNCRCHPEDADYPATDLAEAGFSLEPAEVLTALSETLASALTLWNGGGDFPAIRRAWLEFGPTPGTPVVVATPRGRISGSFGGLAPAGHLLVDTPQGRVTIDAGDVFLPGGITDAMQQ